MNWRAIALDVILGLKGVYSIHFGARADTPPPRTPEVSNFYV